MGEGGNGSNQYKSNSANWQNSKTSQSDAAEMLNVSERLAFQPLSTIGPGVLDRLIVMPPPPMSGNQTQGFHPMLIMSTLNDIIKGGQRKKMTVTLTVTFRSKK